jgi:hypothetical protein
MTWFVHVLEDLVKIEPRVVKIIVKVLNDGVMAPGGDVLANKSKDFFSGIYNFVDSFIIITVPKVARNRKLVGFL